MKVHMRINREFPLSELDERVYCGFLEHLGRAVYSGVYQPGHPAADADGFRTDVIELVKGLNMPMTRYPGGNFVSNYRWEDGVGPKEERPVRLEMAWHCLETNEFGTDEFMKWCKKAETLPMMAVNLGTRGPEEAQALFEYCNFPGGTAWSDQRRANGAEAPYDVKLWCLGNEMDGHWQLGQRTASDYGMAAKNAAKVMREIQPDAELVVCGASSAGMPDFGTYLNDVLEYAYPYVDYVSCHAYYGKGESSAEFLASPERMGDLIDRIAACCDYVMARRKEKRKLMIAFDEWNLWYRTRGNNCPDPKWMVGRRLLEERYTMEDALVFAGLLMTLLRHSDRVKIACLAQTVNVIAPIMTEADGPAWRQTIYHPFRLMSNFGRGTVLRDRTDSPEYTTADGFRVPLLYSCALHNPEANEVVLFLLNRNLSEAAELEVELENFALRAVADFQILRHDDLNAVNSAACEAVAPAASGAARLEGARLCAELPAASWSMIRVALC